MTERIVSRPECIQHFETVVGDDGWAVSVAAARTTSPQFVDLDSIINFYHLLAPSSGHPGMEGRTEADDLELAVILHGQSLQTIQSYVINAIICETSAHIIASLPLRVSSFAGPPSCPIPARWTPRFAKSSRPSPNKRREAVSQTRECAKQLAGKDRGAS